MSQTSPPAPYDDEVDGSPAVSPPYVAGPLRLDAFRGLMLSPREVGNPASFRLMARPYRAVTQRMRRWRERGDLWRDDEPALYFHEYTDGGVSIRGFVGALDISHRAARPQDAAIYPHEGIHPRQADELAARMAEMKLQPAPILLLQKYPQDISDVAEALMQTAPIRSFTDRSGQRHRVWALRDAALIHVMQDRWATTSAVIADGHHRYAAYVRTQASQPGTAHDAGLAMLIDQEKTPLYPGPIHRVLRGTTLEDLRQAARALRLPQRAIDGAPRALAELGPHTILATDGSAWSAFDLPATTSAVETLHRVIVPSLPRGPQHVYFRNSVDTALRDVRPDRDVAVVLPQLSIDDIWAVVRRGDLLPEKATSFQPKPSPGVLLRSLRD